MDFYLIIVILLFFLAVADLIVGVSNDAVNFLNSAIGSQAGTRRTILIVASAGILLGAAFSGGMMEVARKGIFNPELFVFSEVMIIFLAVMLTDIILLDLFNTFGLPTSTTVSIIFELLGASVAMAVLKITAAGEGVAGVFAYINSSNALAIIAGIFISIGVAFTVGVIVQYLTRLLFSFNYRPRMRFLGVIWSGLALTVISYFLLIKGLKGASFIPAEFLNWTTENTTFLLLISFTGTTLLAFLLHALRVDILKIVVLAGTFALAMAFAGNDLVNFIGVPLAGFEAFQTWAASGSPSESLLMESLAQKYPAKTFMLLLAGLVMLLTLWFSGKARSVTETEVNLGRQSEGLERFGSNWLSRGLVRLITGMTNGSGKVLPEAVKEKIAQSFEPVEKGEGQEEAHDPPAFDLLRASVNLTVASTLIAFATSLKLPLSTTYVSFMVAMGTSLSDRAWGRDSAVYRVAGVLNVIGGWFLTAFIAFTISAAFAYLIRIFGMGAIASLGVLALILIYNTFRLHRRKEQAKDRILAAARLTQEMPAKAFIRDTARNTVRSLGAIQEGYQQAIEGLLSEDSAKLNQAKEAIQRAVTRNEAFKFTFYNAIKQVREEAAEASRTYLLAYDLEQDILQSAQFIVDAARQHVADVLMPLKGRQAKDLREVSTLTCDYLQRCAQLIQDHDFGKFAPLMADKQPIFHRIEVLLATQVKGIKEESYRARNSLLFFSLLLETKDLIAVAARFVKLYYRLEVNASPEHPLVAGSGRPIG